MPDYSHQQAAIELMSSYRGRGLFTAPTGSGKTTIQKGVLAARPGGLQLVPSKEIGAGFTNTHDQMAQERQGVYAYRRCLNLLSRGELDPGKFKYILRDEGHHLDETALAIDDFLRVDTIMAVTATAFRGTPQETRRLHDYYDNKIHTLLSIKDAVARGVISIPRFDVVPLHDDDQINVVSGEFSVTAVDQMVETRMDDLVSVLGRFWDGTKFTRPVMVCLTSRYLVEKFCEKCPFPTEAVVGSTEDREERFNRVVRCEAALVQIKVVGEGVDLPIRIIIDASPTMSPVFWMQRVGRCTRPVGEGEEPPLYLCTNHNLLRHGYLFEGFVPASTFKEYKEKWKSWKPTSRAVTRIAGDIAGFGRFKPAEVPLLDGSIAYGMVIDDPTGKGHQYACLMHPATPETICARRDFELDSEGRRDYNKKPKWRKVDRIPDLTGYTSVPASPLTPNMQDWWERDAARVGLDNKATVSARTFQWLPILLNLRLRVKV